MIGALWAQTERGVIGRDNQIPWRYSGDLRRFKRLTMGSAVIMGRKTWESIGKPLPGRYNIVVGNTDIDRAGGAPGLDRSLSVDGAMTIARDGGYENVWFIGGARIYEAAMRYVDLIDVTYVPGDVPVEGSVLAPTIDGAVFRCDETFGHPDEPMLRVERWVRRAGS